MLQKLDKTLARVFIFGLPLMALLAVGTSQVAQDASATRSPVVYTLNGLAGLLLGLWMVMAIYLSARLVFSPVTRGAILPRVVLMRERDEREAFLTGNATKINFLVTLAILVLLLCLNVFHVSLYQVPPEHSSNGHSKAITLGIDFSLLDSPQKNAQEQAKEGLGSLVTYSGLPVSKTAILVLLIIWQIASYNYLMRKFTSEDVTSYSPAV